MEPWRKCLPSCLRLGKQISSQHVNSSLFDQPPHCSLLPTYAQIWVPNGPKLAVRQAAVMVQLLDLPVELLTLITNAVDCFDLANYALACRTCHESAAEPLSQHRGLIQYYGRLCNRYGGTTYRNTNRVCGPPGATNDRFVDLPEQLQEVLDNPKLAYYVRSLALRDLKEHKFYHHVPKRSLDEGGHSIDALVDLSGFSAPPAGSENVGGDDIVRDDRWQNFFQQGSEEIMAGLLISQLSHLSKLELQTDDLWQRTPRPNRILAMLKKMSSTNYSRQIRHVNEQYIPQYALHTEPLSRLTTVVLSQYVPSTSRYGKPTTRHIDLLLFFMTLPSMRTIKSRKPDEWQDRYPEQRADEESNVSSLTLSHGLLNAGFLANVLQNTHSLTHFSYSCPQDSRMPVQAINNALSMYTSDTIQSVSLGSSKIVQGHIQSASWGHFQNLTHLSLDIGAFLPYHTGSNQENTPFSSPQSTISILSQHIPPSLKDLRLKFHEPWFHFDPPDHIMHALPLLGYVMEAREIALPQLKKLELAFRFDEFEDMQDGEVKFHELMEALELACERAQVALTVLYGQASGEQGLPELGRSVQRNYKEWNNRWSWRRVRTKCCS